MSVASVIGTGSAYSLQELSNEACLSLLTQQALGTKNFDAYPHLKIIGEEIVKRCKGSPLAAKTLGGMLRNKLNHEAWADVLGSKIWDFPEERSGILPALKLSYYHLPSHLKRCFAYCSLFPKDYEFNKDELVLLWMAEGFLELAKGKKQMEYVGSCYFHELLSRSFFQQSSQNPSLFMMHDLVHDLAQYVARELFFNLEDKLENKKHITSERARYLSFIRQRHETFTKFRAFNKGRHLRTLLALPINAISDSCYISAKVMNDLFIEIRHLRVLSLTGYHISKLPSSIANLIQLQYLNLSNTSIERLPDSVSDLYNLRALILHNCQNLITLPMKTRSLINLRHLDIAGTSQLQEMPPRIGNLTNLQTLSKFIVGKGNESRAGELKHLLDLHGELYILGLHNVRNIQDAMDANLKDKRGIEELMLEWGSDFNDLRNERNEKDVLELLQPHRNLRKLIIEFYGGSKFPSWIGDPSFSTMVQLNLKNCKNCTLLPSLGQLPLLKHLSIEGMSEVKTIGVEFFGDQPSFTVKPFPSLESLSFSNMPEWEDWSFPNATKEGEGLFPCIRKLTIRQCLKFIHKLPNCLPALVELHISQCPKFTVSLPKLASVSELNVGDCDDLLLRCGIELTSLTTLNFKKISKLTCLPDGFTQFLTALEVLEISDCGELKSLWQNGFGLENLGHLRHLRIKGCSGLVSLEEQVLPCNLKYLRIEYCTNLEELPSGLQSLKCLVELEIEECPRLESFPETGLPHTLRHLMLEYCEGLKTLPHNYHQCLLEYLKIEVCPSLICFPEGELPNTLKHIEIEDCEKLESLPEGMISYNSISANNIQVLRISGCPSLKKLFVQNSEQLESISEMSQNSASLKILPECFTSLTDLSLIKCLGLESFPERGLPTPNLKFLRIENCENLKSLPHQMQNLTSLQELFIRNCQSLVSFPEGGLAPNLISLEIGSCKNLRSPLSECGLYRLTSLSSLFIWDMFPDLVSISDDEGLLPISLTTLSIGKLQVLASLALQNLTTLRELWISNCPKLQSLGLPPLLAKLEIWNCPTIKQRCLKEKGEYWPKIVHIPEVRIDAKLIL